jgi:FHS family L-fucose permease-like MFS transporter
MLKANDNVSPNHAVRLFLAGSTVPFILVTALLLLWGIPSNMNDILIKQFMKSFEMTRLKAGLIQSAFYMGYFLLSMPAALVMPRYGYKAGLVAGLFLCSAGTFLFWPAAHVRLYGFFLCALFVIASGAAFLETGANSFIALLGDPRTSERRLNLSQAFNPLGAVTSVFVGTVFIFSGIELGSQQVSALKAAGKYDAYLATETMRVVTPYLTSFFMSLMFPTIFALGIKELGPKTKLGGSMIIMAIIGGAVATPIMGLLFQMTHSMAVAMLVPLVCYLFITYYAFIGSKVREPRMVEAVVG